MTYEQSLKNIETLKSLVMPLDAHQIFFDFGNFTEFKIILLKNSESEDIDDIVRDKFRSKLPLAKILITKAGYEILYYQDAFISYRFDFATNETLMHDSKESFRKKSATELALAIDKLLAKLKNM
ncbi:MAG: hypothetical protein AABY53_09760 [Bdellovibrionota bacterium]